VGTIFNRATLPGATQLRRYGLALLAIVAVTTIGFLQRIVSTVDLTFSQWSICAGIAASLVVVEEILKVFLRRRAAAGQDQPIEAVATTVAPTSDNESGRQAQ
jgi:Ca2+-transporting ATPase